MFRVLSYILVIIVTNEIMGREGKHQYKFDSRPDFAPGYICNYEAYHLNTLQFVLYTCVHSFKCHKPNETTLWRRPELPFDNCVFAFPPPTDGGSYICCHPEDNEETKGGNPNATIDMNHAKFIPGFRSAFKCRDYAQLVCLNSKFCPRAARRGPKGGKEVSIEKYAHLAVIGWYNPKTHEQNWFCLGSVISERFVLSAASCQLDKDLIKPNYVRLGESDLCKIGVDCPPSLYIQRIPIDGYDPNAGNYLTYYYNDIMLFRLEHAVDWNSQVRPACLSADMYATHGGGMFAMYENRTVHGQVEDILIPHEMEIEVFGTTPCSRWYNFDIRLVEGEYDPELMFCAGLPQAEKVPCTYDYGGPLQMQDDDGATYCMWQIFGVMAYSQTFFCKGHKPPIFTRVAYYLDWIEGVVWPEFDMLKEKDTCSAECRDALVPAKGNSGRCKA